MKQANLNPRCVNLDWLEVHALEPIEEPRDAAYFRALGFEVIEREYGTRIYEEMFTLCEHGTGYPMIEVRRRPKSSGLKGIHAINECHLRLTNRTCYFDNAAQLMQDFMTQYGFIFRRISRVDICLDFSLFDSGDVPEHFIKRYIKGKYAKINQANITAHGSDRWSGQDWNSLSWGSAVSDIGTKFYDKTMELYDPLSRTYRKPYIRQAWMKCGLVTNSHTCELVDAQGNVSKPRIWRLEFSIRSSVRRWFMMHLNGDPKQKQSVRNTLDMYDSRHKLFTLWASLCSHYFRFKIYEPDKRKDLCRDKQLFDFSRELQYVYKVGRDSVASDGRMHNPVPSLIAKLQSIITIFSPEDVRAALRIITTYLEGHSLSFDLANPFSREELQALQYAISCRTQGLDIDSQVLIAHYKELLRLNDKAAPF